MYAGLIFNRPDIEANVFFVPEENPEVVLGKKVPGQKRWPTKIQDTESALHF